MGHQEMIVKLQPNVTEKKVMDHIKACGMDYYIDLLGYYTYKNQKYYLVFATDRHPGADFLVANYNAIELDKVYEDFKRLYVYESIDGGG